MKEFDPVLARKAVLFVCAIFDDWRLQKDDGGISCEIDKLHSNVKLSVDAILTHGRYSARTIACLAFYCGAMAERESIPITRPEQAQESTERRMFPLPCAQCFGTCTMSIMSIDGELEYVPCYACQDRVAS